MNMRTKGSKVFVVLLFIWTLLPAVHAQITLTDPMYRVYDGQGNPSSLDAIVSAMVKTDAIFLGEQHDDAVGHPDKRLNCFAEPFQRIRRSEKLRCR